MSNIVMSVLCAFVVSISCYFQYLGIESTQANRLISWSTLIAWIVALLASLASRFDFIPSSFTQNITVLAAMYALGMLWIVLKQLRHLIIKWKTRSSDVSISKSN